MKTEEILSRVNYIIDTYREKVLSLFEKGGNGNLQEAAGYLFHISYELERSGLANAILVMYAELIRLQACCQAFKFDSPIEHFKRIVGPVVNRFGELSQGLSHDPG